MFRRLFVKRLVLRVIKFYEVSISPYSRGVCRHAPTCSRYAKEAIAKHGVYKGGWLFLKRFCRCRPFGTRGYDPVP